MSWEPPSELEEYRIVRALGAGAMGQVFLAHDSLLDRPVAIKFVAALEVGAAARERFFTEARAVARLSHPNVVAIHRVSEIRNRPYLVSEYVRGQSLAALPKPVPWERALRIATGLARGLAAAHRRGVLHRDIKPANAMLGDDDEPKLLDFGLAKLLEHRGVPPRPAEPVRWVAADEKLDATVSSAALRDAEVFDARALSATASIAGRGVRPVKPMVAAVQRGLTVDGAILGTPLYLAPELWTGSAATARSDVYALGVVLYELLAGRPPHAGATAAELASGTAAAPIASIVADLPARLAALVDACVSVDPAARPESGEELSELLDAITLRDMPVVDGSPYRGLGTFEPEHRGVFFGRSEEARAVVERLRTETFVVVAGDSGAGKSSLCRAAVLPTIAEKSIGGVRWRTATMLPGARPRARLDEALASRAEGEGLLLFVDQLEELLTVADPEEAAYVAETLAELVVATSSVRVLASARGDFLGRLAALPGLGELVGRALYLLGPLGERGLREAIAGPARTQGYDMAGVIVDELVASGRRNLPLLQFTLAELWDARDDKARTIPAEALERIGGVAGALSRRADQVMAALGDADREIAWRVFVRLMTSEGTRAVLTRGELAEAIGERAAVERVVERLVAARLLSVADGDERVEVVHEALFTGWSRLVEWRRAHEEGTRMRDLHTEAARAWDKQGRPRGLLWRGDALADYRAWRRRWPEQPTGLEAAFAAASETEAKRTRNIRAALFAAVFAALAIGMIVLYRADQRAVAERDEAVAQRAEAVRQTEQAHRRRLTLLVEHGAQELAAGLPARALPYLVEAMRAGEDTPAVRVLIAEAARPLERAAVSIRDMRGGFSNIAWFPDGSKFVAVAIDGDARIYNRAGQQLHRIQLAVDPILNLQSLAIDGGRVAFAGCSGVRVWTPATGALATLDPARDAPGTRSCEAIGLSGTHVAAASPAAGLRVWNHGGTQTYARAEVQNFAVTPRGLLVMTPTGLDEIDLAGRSLRTPIPMATAELTELQVARAGSRAATLTATPDKKGTVGLWDLSTGKLVRTIDDARRMRVGDRYLLVPGDNAIQVFDTATGARITSVPSRSDSRGEIDPTGTRIVVWTWGDRRYQIWNVADERLELAYESPTTSPTTPHSTANTVGVAFSPDGELLLTAAGNEATLLRMSRAPLLDELASDGQPLSARLSPDERTLAIATITGKFELWDLATRRLVARVDSESAGNKDAWPDRLEEVTWSPDGRTVAIAGSRGRLLLYARDGVALRSLLGHDPAHRVNGTAFGRTASSPRSPMTGPRASGPRPVRSPRCWFTRYGCCPSRGAPTGDASRRRPGTARCACGTCRRARS